MYKGHFLGPVIRHLQELRMRGASAFELMSYLQTLYPEARPMASRYMNSAFLRSGLRLIGILRFGEWEDFGPDHEMWPMADSCIDDAKDDWINRRFPELMRIRDYFSFLEFADANNAHIIVRDASPHAGVLIGKAGYRCYDGGEFLVARDTLPHLGCLAADPGDPRLLSTMTNYLPSLSYEDYVDRLRGKGLLVGGSEEGYVVTDTAGRRLYQGYQLHGVYDRSDWRSMWTASSGECLRAELNRRLGHELIVSGPHDDWEFRNNREVAGPLAGPQAPAIEFQPGMKILNLFSVDEMRTSSPVYQSNWSRLYADNANNVE